MSTRLKHKQEWPYVTFSEQEKMWKVDGRTRNGGKREFFAIKADATKRAAILREQRGNQGAQSFGNDELSRRGKTVQNAIDFYLEHLRAQEKSVSVADAIELLIADRKSANRSEQYLRDLRNRLSRFEKDFADFKMATITAQQIGEWLAALTVAPGTRNTFRRDLRTLFSFCKKIGKCADNEAKKTTLATTDEHDIEILTVPQAAHLLEAATDDLIPYFAISLFAGVRAAELQKLDWASVDLEGGHLTVTKKASKGGRKKRLVPISKNLAAWIQRHAKESGLVCNPVNFRKRLDAAHRAAGYGTPGTETDAEKANGVRLTPWPSNAMRHSFGSYRLRQCNDLAKTALEMGNSPAIVEAHYHELVKPKVAEQYWAIMPPRR